MTLSGHSHPHTMKRLIRASVLLLSTPFAINALASSTSHQVTADIVGVENFFAERCLSLEVGQTIIYHYESIHPLDFNIHQHPNNNSVVFLRKEENLASLRGEFVVESNDHYCFTWTNMVERGGEEWNVVLDYQVTTK